MTSTLTAEDLLTVGSATFPVPIPAALVRPGEDVPPGAVMGEVVLRPLLVRDVERITRAAKEQRVLTSVLMVNHALVSPKLSIDQVSALPAGLLQFLLERVNALSGLSLDEEGLEAAVRAPLTRACFLLAREFGWTPAQCAELTVGQILVYVEMLGRHEAPVAEAV